MTEEKLHKIISELQGITYIEWKKLKRAVDVAFETEVKSVTQSVTLSRRDIVEQEY